MKCDINQINLEGKDYDFNDDEYDFFHPAEEFKNDIKRFYKHLLCIKKGAEIRGDFNSNAGKQLLITFSICRGETYCRPESEIMSWMARKFIVTLENTMSFSKDEVHLGVVANKYSKLVWNVVSPQMKTEYYHYVELKKLELTDKIMSIGFDTEVHHLFDTFEGTLRVWDFPGDVHTAITFELNRDLMTINRKVYGILDWLSDVGGLAGALIAAFSVFVMIF